MDATNLSQSPFAVLTFIAAPAVLTNATSVLAMSTINRMLRTRDRMQQLFEMSEKPTQNPADAQRLLDQVNRVERQASLLLRAMHSIYVALGAFAAASLVTLLGVVLEHWQVGWLRVLIGVGLLLGFLGVGGLIAGCLNLLRVTRLSIANIRQEADTIRDRQEQVRRKLSSASDHQSHI